MDYADFVKTGTMPPAIAPSEEERKRMLIASAGGMSTMPPLPLARSAANATATMSPEFLDAAKNAVSRQSRPTSADTDRDGAPPTQELSRHALPSVKRQLALAAPANAPGPASSSEVPSRDTMPPIPLTGRAKDLAYGATSRPSFTYGPDKAEMDANARAIPAPDLNAMPALPGYGEGLKVTPGQPAKPASFSEASAPAVDRSTMPPVQLGPEMQRYQELARQGEPKLPFWKKALDVAGSIFPIGRAIETAIPGTPQNYDFRFNQAATRAAKEQALGKGEQEAEDAASKAQFNTPEKRRAYMQKNPDLFDDVSDFEKHDWVLSGKFPGKEPAPEKTTDKKIDEYVNDKGQRVLTFQRADNSTYDKVGGQTQPKPAGHTSAFEAFAYGDPEEKEAAEDFLAMEKRLGARYRTPNEFEEKYRLFKEDSETYKAMFGDKAGQPDRATATRMLNYFDKRRREVNGDFTLDETQKQEQLRDIENLEKPFMDAVQPDARGGDDRVNVIGPDGTPGTVPRSQLEKAKKKGYKVAGQP